MPIEIKHSVNLFRHDNHVPPATPTQRNFTTTSHPTFFLLSNTSAVTVYLSFDGTNLLTIASGGVFTAQFSNILSYWTKGDGVATVEVLVGSEK